MSIRSTRPRTFICRWDSTTRTRPIAFLIEEIYIVAVEARSNGQQRIPVHIFPGKLDEDGLADLLREAGEGSELARFWINLREGYEAFEKTRVLPEITVDGSGRYRIRVQR
jgi:murein L,D-transpeptidase YafK